MRLAEIDPDGVRSRVMSALDVTGLPTGALYVYARCQRTGRAASSSANSSGSSPRRGGVVSGINGTDSAVGNGTPMLWAGATSKDTRNNAAFRVYNSGHVDMGDVSITSAGADGRLTLSEGDIMLSKSSGSTTSLSSKAMGKAGGDSVDVNAMMNGKNISVNETIRAVSGRKGGITVKTYTAASTEALTLFTAPNAMIKAFRSQFRGVGGIKFFMYRLATLYS